jgi:hypothetical protein
MHKYSDKEEDDDDCESEAGDEENERVDAHPDGVV